MLHLTYYLLIAALVILAIAARRATFNLAIVASVVLFAAAAVTTLISLGNPHPDTGNAAVGLGLYGLGFLMSVVAFFMRKQN